jgi:hypothetical protein
MWGASYVSPTLRVWLGTAPTETATLGGFLYVTIASILAGLIVSTIRWLVIDTLLHWTGIPRLQWDFTRLQAHIGAYSILNENHYRYYQWYSGMVVAIVAVIAFRRLSLGPLEDLWTDAGLAVLAVLLLVGARDTFSKYYLRLNQLLTDGDEGPKKASPANPTVKTAKATGKLAQSNSAKRRKSARETR